MILKFFKISQASPRPQYEIEPLEDFDVDFEIYADGIKPGAVFEKVKDKAGQAIHSIIKAAGKPTKNPVKEFPEKIKPYVTMIGEVSATDELNALLKAIKETPDKLQDITDLAIKLMKMLTNSNRFKDLTPAVGLLIRIVGANKTSGDGILEVSVGDVMKNCSGIVGFANIEALFAIASGMSKNTDDIKAILKTLVKENFKKTGTQCLLTVAKVIFFAAIAL